MLHTCVIDISLSLVDSSLLDSRRFPLPTVAEKCIKYTSYLVLFRHTFDLLEGVMVSMDLDETDEW